MVVVVGRTVQEASAATQVPNLTTATENATKGFFGVNTPENASLGGRMTWKHSLGS
jgi:hypothetical protein